MASKYTYLSDGRKVSSCDASGNGYMYLGTARFTLENNVPTFESVPFSGGRIVKTSNGYEPQYYLTDHLGSTRMIVNKDGQTVEAAFDYTPFGVQITNSASPICTTEYRFSGKELQNIPDSEIYDFGARQYFPKYAIWGSVDPLADSFSNVSPFAYCNNNPVLFVDPNGMMYDKYYNENGELIYDTGVGDKAFVIKTSNDNLVGGACIDETAAQDTEQKISSGQLEGDHMQNVVEIVPIATLKAAKSTIKDDGTGSHPLKPDNQRETGGNILEDNSIANVTHGPMRGSNGKLNANVNIPQNSKTKATYHSHPSGTIMVNGKKRGSSTYPSPNDYKLAGDRINYIFQMRNKQIIIYNNTNIVATLPFTVVE